MTVLGTALELGSSFLAGGGVGLVARAGMQVIGYFQKKQDDKHALEVLQANNAHELLMLDKNLAVAQAQVKGEIDKLQVAGSQAVALEEARAFTVAQERAATPTGIRWVDAWNASMKPFGYYALFGTYAFGKLVSLIAAIATLFSAFSREVTILAASQKAQDLLTLSFTSFDMSLIGSMAGFIWADRTFSRNFASTATRNS